MKQLFFLSLVSLLPLNLSAQNTNNESKHPWDIEQCIVYALDNNIQIKQSKTDIQLSNLNSQEAKMAYIPTLSASAAHSTNWGRSLDPTTYNFVNNQTVNNVNGGISLGTTLFAGMQKLHNLKRSELNLLATIQSNLKLQNDIVLSVAGSYLQVLYDKERIENAKSQITSLTHQVERTRKLVDAGAQPLGAVLELEAQLASENYNLVTAKNSLANSLLTLKQLLELQNKDDFDVVSPTIDSLPQSMSQTIEEVYHLAQSLPQIELSKLQTKIAREELSLAKARMYPTLNFGVNYGSSWSDARLKPQMGENGQAYYTNYPFFNQLGDNASTSMQFSLSIPIFNGLNAQRGIRKAKVSMQKAELGENLAQNQLLKEIQQAYTDANGALEKYFSAQTSLKSAEKSFDYAQQKFSAGATTSVDYTTAKNNLIVAQSMQTQAKYEYLLRSKILDFYAGIPITL